MSYWHGGVAYEDLPSRSLSEEAPAALRRRHHKGGDRHSTLRQVLPHAVGASELLERGVPRKDIIHLDLDKRGYRRIKAPDQLEEAVDALIARLA